MADEIWEIAREILINDSGCARHFSNVGHFFNIDRWTIFRAGCRFIAIAMAITLAGGTTGFVLIEHYPVFDAFYMTLTTVTTVGYGEIHALSQAGRVFNSFLIFFGVSLMLLAIGAMTQTVIELELNQFFGKRRIKNMIDKLDGHIILCGFGRVGRGAADEFARPAHRSWWWTAMRKRWSAPSSRACWRCSPTRAAMKRCATSASSAPTD